MKKMLSTYSSEYTLSSAAQTEFKSITVNLTAGEELCVALNWNFEATPIDLGENNSGLVYAPNVDIRLYDPSGTPVSNSAYDGNSSTEYIRYAVPSSGDYRIALYNHETYSLMQLQYGLAYSKQ